MVTFNWQMDIDYAEDVICIFRFTYHDLRALKWIPRAVVSFPDELYGFTLSPSR